MDQKEEILFLDSDGNTGEKGRNFGLGIIPKKGHTLRPDVSATSGVPFGKEGNCREGHSQGKSGGGWKDNWTKGKIECNACDHDRQRED